MNLLILGGTTEASTLARLIAAQSWPATLSLAGRTSNPARQPIPCRIGGFGGAEGLAAYLHDHQIDILVDATHPFAAQITRNAAIAAKLAAIPLLAILRPPWRPRAGDRWRPVADMQAAAEALGAIPRRVLLTIGQQDLAPFRPPHHYVVRSVDPPATPPAGAHIITARGPFHEPGERQLLHDHRIDVLVTKNAGGTATEAKLAAARALGLEVIMVARPPPPDIPPDHPTVASAEAAMAWLESHVATLRGE